MSGVVVFPFLQLRRRGTALHNSDTYFGGRRERPSVFLSLLRSFIADRIFCLSTIYGIVHGYGFACDLAFSGFKFGPVLQEPEVSNGNVGRSVRSVCRLEKL
jgi:hypothetical protein